MLTDITSAQIDGSFVPVRRGSVASVEIGGEGVLLDQITIKVHLLDPIANVVWSCMDGSGTIDELAADLSDAFGVSLEQVRRDILVLATELGRRGLLEGVIAEQEDVS